MNQVLSVDLGAAADYTAAALIELYHVLAPVDSDHTFAGDDCGADGGHAVLLADGDEEIRDCRVAG